MNRLRQGLGAVILITTVGTAAPQSNDQLAYIAGAVFESGTSRPVAKADVILFGPGERARATRTDSEGKFAFPEIEPGAQKLTAKKNGYVYQTFRGEGRRGDSAHFDLAPGQRLTGADFHLSRAPVVTGSILDHDGDPAPNARVLLMVPTYSLGRRQLLPRGHSQTNDLGEYRIHNAAPGDYFLAVDYKDDLVNDPGVQYEGADEGGYDHTFYPGVGEANDALPVLLRAGEQRSIDLQLRRVPTVRLSGRVRLDGSGPPPRDTTLEIVPEWDALGRLRGRFTSAAEGTGEFEFRRVPRGAYVLRAMESAGGTQVSIHQRLKVSDADVGNLELRLAPVASVRGRVKLVGYSASEFSFEKRLIVLGLHGIPHNPGNTADTADEMGAVSIDGIPPATYAVKVSNLPPDAYLKTVRIGERELPQRKLTLQAGEIVERLEVVVSLDGGLIGGVVIDEDLRPRDRARVIAGPEDTSAVGLDYIRWGKTDQHGRFDFRGLEPGRYRLLAINDDELDPDVFYQSEFLRALRLHGEPVEMDDGSRLDLTLRPIAARSVGAAK